MLHTEPILSAQELIDLRSIFFDNARLGAFLGVIGVQIKDACQGNQRIEIAIDKIRSNGKGVLRRERVGVSTQGKARFNEIIDSLEERYKKSPV